MEERQIAGHRSSFARLLVTLSVGALLPFTQAVAQKTAAAPSSRSVAQKKSTWVVRPEWVAAHEHFLSSDAMHGRGSATRDETDYGNLCCFRVHGLWVEARTRNDGIHTER